MSRVAGRERRWQRVPALCGVSEGGLPVVERCTHLTPVLIELAITLFILQPVSHFLPNRHERVQRWLHLRCTGLHGTLLHHP